VWLLGSEHQQGESVVAQPTNRKTKENLSMGIEGVTHLKRKKMIK
jgi:hypothetical protein